MKYVKFILTMFVEKLHINLDLSHRCYNFTDFYIDLIDQMNQTLICWVSTWTPYSTHSVTFFNDRTDFLTFYRFRTGYSSLGFSMKSMPNTSWHWVCSLTVIFRLILEPFLQPLFTNRLVCMKVPSCGCWSRVKHVVVLSSTKIPPTVPYTGFRQET